MRRIGLLVISFMVLLPSLAFGANFRFQKVKEGVVAALAEPGGKAASNCLIIMTSYQVIIAGAHFTPETTRELFDHVRSLTPIPVRSIILTHHHRGFNYIDFDLPANVEIITSAQAWQALRSEFRQVKNQLTFFDRSLTMKRGSTTIVLNNTIQGHSEGDVFIYLPEENVLFTSDLFFNDVAGYMGDGHLREWLATLELLAGIDARYVVPGLGVVTDSDGIRRFQAFFRDFTTEILRLIALQIDPEIAKRRFALPQHENMPGFRAFFDVNFKRAFTELKEMK